MTQFAPSDNEAWGLGWALGQALSEVDKSRISGFLSQLFLIPTTSSVPGAQAFVAEAAPAGSAPPVANALDTLAATKSAHPEARFFVNPATASMTHVDVLVSLDPNVSATVAAPGSAWGELPLGAAAPAAAPTKKNQNASILVGALVGGALGAALGGPVGAIGGGVVGGFVGNAVSKKA